ncbi:hypothetical protein PsYK624_131370 [Phanerochaete sordida]|uniref:Uncharacterized protein n=1 Tax=Phanerochaete sordida TaxID=48140 RepID=A0A9P3GMF8_9APHY|nr:hypothetical protein PsYK624_131370 [Phanerochaete sordida]
MKLLACGQHVNVACPVLIRVPAVLSYVAWCGHAAALRLFPNAMRVASLQQRAAIGSGPCPTCKRRVGVATLQIIALHAHAPALVMLARITSGHREMALEAFGLWAATLQQRPSSGAGAPHPLRSVSRTATRRLSGVPSTPSVLVAFVGRSG